MRAFRVLLFPGAQLILMAGSLFAQATAPSTTTDQYRIGAGVSYDYYGATGFASTVDIDARTCALTNTCDPAKPSKVWYHVSLEMTPQQAVLKPGAEYELYRNGNWGVSLFGDVGLATGTGATLGAFAGGGKLSWDFGSVLTKGASHYYAEFVCKIMYLNGATGATALTAQSNVQPIFGVVFTKGF